VFIATQLNWTQLTQLKRSSTVELRIQPSQSCFCLWRHDLQTESTVVHAVKLSSVELSCVANRYNTPLTRSCNKPQRHCKLHNVATYMYFILSLSSVLRYVKYSGLVNFCVVGDIRWQKLNCQKLLNSESSSTPFIYYWLLLFNALVAW